METDVRTPDY